MKMFKIVFKYLVIAIYLFKNCSFKQRAAVVWRNDRFDSFNFTGWKIHMTEPVSQLQCFILCLSNPACYGVQFNYMVKICHQLSFKCAETSHLLAANYSTNQRALTPVSFYHVLKGEPCQKQNGYTFSQRLCLCVKFYPDPLHQLEANSTCYGDGGELVRIDNARKQRGVLMYVTSLGLTTGKVTIQGKRNDSQWFFDDKTVFTYFNWNTEKNQPNLQPTEEYLYLNVGSNGVWHDIQPGPYQFICEIQL